MRIINKKYLLIILLVGVILTGVIVFKPKQEVMLDNVILKQEVNNKTFAMYTETDSGYEEYKDTRFPDMYVLNIEKSKCIDNNGNELDGVLSYENDKVTITSGNTTYCYLYFDKSLGLEIKELSPKGLSIDKVRGAMYRFQGQAKDAEENELVDNYICFGTSDKNTCTGDTDHYMYRIIGIEASTGRVKVIKKESLNVLINWWDNYDEDIEFPGSNVYKVINGDAFFGNTNYVPDGWEEKIDNNTWTYGDIVVAEIGLIGEELYQVETGQKETIWYEKANKEDDGALPYIVGDGQYQGQTFYYISHNNEKWTKSFPSKVSLMYVHDYYYSVSDEAICNQTDGICQTGWMHLSQNDPGAFNGNEWTMTRSGWNNFHYAFMAYHMRSTGVRNESFFTNKVSARPVFYINASEELLSGTETGTIDDPFIIETSN